MRRAAWRVCQLAQLVSLSCGSRQLQLTLLYDEEASPGRTVTSVDAHVTWDAGQLDRFNLPFAGSFSLPVPSEVPLELEIDARSTVGEQWRGEAHGVVLPSGGAAEVTLFFGRVGALSSFTSLVGLPPLAGSSATPLDRGRVLIVGGSAPDGGPVASAWIYDHARVSFSSAAPPLHRWAHHLALPLGDGTLLLAGGDGTGTDVEIYDPTQGGLESSALPFSQTQVRGIRFAGDAGALLGCGIASGILDAGGDLELWPAASEVPLSCAGGRVLLADDGAVVFGAPTGEVRAVLPDGGNHFAGSLAVARTRFAAISLAQGGSLLIGGLTDGGASDSIEAFPAAAHASQPLQVKRSDAEAIVLDDGSVLVVGGADTGGNSLSSVEILSPPAFVSSRLLQMSAARSHPAVARIPGYRAVLILSGEDDQGQPSGGLEIFTTP